MNRLPLLLVTSLLAACGGAPPAGDDAPAKPLSFREQTLEPELGIGYAVTIADVNKDDRLDVLALSENKVMWFENPSWDKRVVSEDKAIPDHVCFAPEDIDGDGKLDLALGADWQARNTNGAGTLQWLRQGDDPGGEWTLHPITSEPTLHRIRWADVEGDGRRELIVAPLHGRATSGPQWWNGAGARLMALRPPADPTGSDWEQEVAEDSFHVIHNIWVVNFDDDPADELLTASYEGVHLLDRGEDGEWTRTRLGLGHQLGDGDKGAGEIKVGRLADGRRYIATIEPWHTSYAVVYEQDGAGEWVRRVLTDQLGGGHALATADFDGDGDDELAVGWRLEGQGDFSAPGVAVFDPGAWGYQIIDSGGMATEDLDAADLDGDGRPELAASGRATHNLKIYSVE